MRLSIAPTYSRFGNVVIRETSRVIELDAGLRTQATPTGASASKLPASNTYTSFSQASISSIERRLAIVVPCMNEDITTLDGVLHGIPHECFTIIVSNSTPSKFLAEYELLAKFCSIAGRLGIIVHQGDESLAHAFCTAGMPDLVIKTSVGEQDPTYRIRNGKGEALIVGTTLAKLIGKKYVGFIDADNLVPGAVHEYCKVYAAGLHHTLCSSKSSLPPYAMVRIMWNSKPKVKDNQLVFEESGRCSRVVNEWMNRLLNEIHHFDAAEGKGDVIETANAGEHAISLDLALKLRFATGYAVEPFQLINVWERFGSPASNSPMASRDVQILQVKTRNPHFHDVSKGDMHIEEMQVQGLSTIYFSRLTPTKLKEELREYLKNNFPKSVDEHGVPTQEARTYPPIGTLSFELFETELKKDPNAMRVVGSHYPQS